MATLIKVDGTQTEVQPANGKKFKLDELYELIGCKYIELVTINSKEYMVVDEDGKMAVPIKPLNKEATRLFKGLVRLPGDYIAGDAVLCLKKEV